MITPTMEQAYRPIRNRLRRLHPRSTVQLILELLQENKGNDIVSNLANAPWLYLLLVKWTCQDSMAGMQSERNATQDDIIPLVQTLWELPGRLTSQVNASLFMRQIMRPQLQFQRIDKAGLIRDAAILLSLPAEHRVRIQFEKQSGLTLHALIDLSLALISHLENQHNRILPEKYFQSYSPLYDENIIENYYNCISQDFTGLRIYFTSLPDAQQKRKSELFEFPLISRYPFYRSNGNLFCWHPSVAYYGMSGLIHSILKESGQQYVKDYGLAYELYVKSIAHLAHGTVYDEKQLQNLIPDGEKTTDFLISTPDCNIFVEAKSGVFGENVMTSGNNEILQDKLKAVNHAIQQGRSASHWVRANTNTPAQVLKAPTDFLLIVTNKELILGNGARLSDLYGVPLDAPSGFSNQRLALERVYIVAIEDFERLILAEQNNEINLPDFLSQCGLHDSEPESAKLLMDQHLTAAKVAYRCSALITDELDRALGRAENLFPS